MLLAAAVGASAQGGAGTEAEKVSLHFQTTFVSQEHDSFRSPYQGQNSLLPGREVKNTFTHTLFFGWRAWSGGEIYLNPEIAYGRGFSDVTGLAGFPNGEIAKAISPDPTLYRARAFLRQTFGLGGGATGFIAGKQNQLPGRYDAKRLVITLGNFSALDIFDDNRYAHEPREQFLNWALVTNGAWDFPADSRGYTWGGAIEYITPVWALRYGRLLMPREANGLRLDPKSHGDVVELKYPHHFGERDGAARVLFFSNTAHMGSYRQTLDNMSPGLDLALTAAYRRKYGWAVNLEQELASWAGAFTRLGWNDGHSETFAWTEIDRHFSVGVSLKGALWGRPGDVLGIAAMRNGLSEDHRDFLAAGGHGFILGDGALNYGTERILESYYLLAVTRRTSATIDFQHVSNPAYNRDRGPVNIVSLRLHYGF